MRAAALRAGHGIRWYLRQVTGEAKWDSYLEGCLNDDVEPMSRRDFERHRSEHLDKNPRPRCC
jgi:hypothetical protein